MADFEHAYRIGRDNEGGYVNIPSDKGGETYCGISRVNWPNWKGWPIIDGYKDGMTIKRGTIYKGDAMLESLVKQFYFTNFWKRIHGDIIDSQAIATYMYDWTLTSGGAIKKIQASIGVDADGSFGNKSVEALNAKGEQWLAVIRDLRVKYYEDIVARTPAQSVNLKGWLSRANGLYEKLAA